MKKKTEKQQPDAAEETSEATERAEAKTEARDSAEQERDRLRDQLQRAMADLQNIRKRHVKEMDDARKRAIEGLATELLPVLDNFHLATEAQEQDTASDSMAEGLSMVRSLLESVLERHGLREIPSMHEVFDPNLHEAVGVDERDDVDSGHVSKVMLRGYTIGERVIRPAKVFVASPTPSTDDAGNSDSEAD